MADYGFKISQDGFDVKTCDDKDLVMSSKFNMLKTAATGITSGAVAHGLAYIPIFFSNWTITVSGKSGFMGDDTATCGTTNFTPYAPAGPTRYYIFYHQF
jgi:hypothetical protein